MIDRQIQVWDDKKGKNNSFELRYIVSDYSIIMIYGKDQKDCLYKLKKELRKLRDIVIHDISNNEPHCIFVP